MDTVDIKQYLTLQGPSCQKGRWEKTKTLGWWLNALSPEAYDLGLAEYVRMIESQVKTYV